MSHSHKADPPSDRCRWCGLQGPLGAALPQAEPEKTEQIECYGGALLSVVLEGVGSLIAHSAKEILPALARLEQCIQDVSQAHEGQWLGQLGTYQLFFELDLEGERGAARRAIKAMLDLQESFEEPLGQMAMGGLILAPLMAADVGKAAVLDTGEHWQPIPEFKQQLGLLLSECQHFSGVASEALISLLGTRIQSIPLSLAGGKAAFRVLAWLDSGPERPSWSQEGFSVGRDGELRHFTRRWQEVSGEGGPWVISLVGPDGSGKRRLMEEFILQVLDGEQAIYAMGAASPTTRLMPLAPLGEALLDLLQVSEYDTPEQVWARLLHGAKSACRALNTKWVDGEAEGIGALVARLLGMDAVAKLSKPMFALSPEQLQERGLFALRRLLGGLCHNHPKVLILANLEWADSLTLAFIQSLATEGLPGRGRLLLMLSAQASLFESCENFGQGWDRHEMIRLARLDKPYLLQIGQDVANRRGGIPSWLMDDFVDRADGNPYFMEQLAHLAAGKVEDGHSGSVKGTPGGMAFDEDELLIDEEASDDRAGWPDQIDEALKRRIFGLEAGSRTLVKLAAQIGSLFAEPVLQALWIRQGRAEQWGSLGLERLEGLGLLRRCPGTHWYRFRGHGLWKAAVDATSQGERMRWSAQLAQVLAEGKGGNRRRAYYGQVAGLYANSGAAQQAFSYYVLGARHARRTGAKAEAVECLKLAGQCVEGQGSISEKTKLSAMLLQGALRLSLGDRIGALRELSAAADMAQVLGEQLLEIKALLVLCQAFDRQEWLEKGDQALSRLQGLTDGTSVPSMRMKYLIQGGWAHLSLSEADAADAFFEQGAQLLADLELEARDLGESEYALGLAFWIQGDLEGARRCFRGLTEARVGGE